MTAWLPPLANVFTDVGMGEGLLSTLRLPALALARVTSVTPAAIFVGGPVNSYDSGGL